MGAACTPQLEGPCNCCSENRDVKVSLPQGEIVPTTSIAVDEACPVSALSRPGNADEVVLRYSAVNPKISADARGPERLSIITAETPKESNAPELTCTEPRAAPEDVQNDNTAADCGGLAASLADIFSHSTLCGRRACAISSCTDADGQWRKSYDDKDQEFHCPPGREADQAALSEWLQESVGVGWACKKGHKPACPNQDSFSVIAVENEFVLIAVYDGHGPNGHDVSEFASKEMARLFLQHSERSSDTRQALMNAFEQVQQSIVEISSKKSSGDSSSGGFDAWLSGSTGTIVYLNIPEYTITTAHVGDARTVLGRRRPGVPVSGPGGNRSEGWQEASSSSSAPPAAQRKFISLQEEDNVFPLEYHTEDLTEDHKPDLPLERARIESANPPGRVIYDGFVNYRVFVQNGMFPGLNMSRALGDICAHQRAGLTAVPDVRTIDLSPMLNGGSKVTLLVCSDGVWEFISSSKAFALIETAGSQHPTDISNMLASASWTRWMQHSHGQICDDITAVCIHLDKACSQAP